MDLAKAILLGIVQGVTEFLPVSSSGHLALLQVLLDFPSPGVLGAVALHGGTFLATVVFFRRDLAAMARALVRAGPRIRRAPVGERQEADLRLAGLLVVGVAATGIPGIFLRGMVARAFEHPAAVGASLLVTGAILWLSGRRPFRGGRRPLETMRLRDALVVGLAQAAALVPGISRSGTTIAAGMACGLQPRASARYSFLLSLPAVLGANLLTWLGSPAVPSGPAAGGAGSADLRLLLGGAAAAAIAGWFSLRLLLRILERTGLAPFAWYCALVGGAVLAWQALA